jgi:drug/metabolite transporter (DMT)-like permease
VIETAAWTVVALVAFASNSILTRLALGTRQIDAVTFTLVRLLAGSVMLGILATARDDDSTAPRHHRRGGSVTLFVYAASFSFAYLRIGAGVGALVLFGAVQVTMIGVGLAGGERPAGRTWIGLVVSVVGLLALVIPSAAARPDTTGIALMTIAGVAWGVYSLHGRGAADPIDTNARNFAWSLPFAIALGAALYRSIHATTTGLLLAAAAGSVTSGLGYAVWFRALRGLTATQAAVVQLSVPVIAALGGVALLGEMLTGRLILSGAGVLGGVALALSVPSLRRKAP